jgi:uncharacterized membrane protein YeaQ/YmgE (transglycosylase-associated protein family)
LNADRSENLAIHGGKTMIGMNLLSFLVLLGISVIVVGVFHYGLRYRILEGIDAVYAKIAFAWLGAWLGSPVLGYWSYKVADVYLVPAFLGAITALVLNGITWKALTRLFTTLPTTEKGVPPSLVKAA